MNDGMMEVIESQARTNGQLVLALRRAHSDLEDLKEHIASMTGPDLRQQLGPLNSVPTVTEQDSQSETPNMPVQTYSSIDDITQVYKLIGELAENNAVHADRKAKLHDLVLGIERRMVRLIQQEQDHLDRAQEAEDLATYHKGQTAQYKANWEALSAACRLFSDNFNRENMNDDVRGALDDMLSKCEVATHNV